MANTNTNTDNNALLSTDIYDISNFLDQIRNNNISDIDETSSMVGIFGYMNEMFSQTLQNSLIVASESTNETIPTRAKFTKNVINHAMNLGINDIYAIPATMTMMLYLPISYLEANFIEVDYVNGKGKFILSKEVPINVGGYSFHLDYDVIITRVKNLQGTYVYTAMYDLFESGTTNIKQSNPISNINNPYITTVIQTTIDGTDFVAFSARLHQVSLYSIEKSILTSTSIENKVVTFEFEEQLAAFDVDIIENDKVTHLTPIYYGLLDYTIKDNSWCYYTHLDENTIRIIFSSDSYVPSMNAIVRINVQISDGSDGNFTYNNNFRTSLVSDKYNNYNGMYILVYPLLNGISSGGRDKKSIYDLKKIIPREASSRGAIINTTDLQNYFNSINNNECKLYFKKKRDNPFERMYYAYMLMRKDGYIYPTNTLNAFISQSQFKGFANNNNLVITPGTKFYYYDNGTNESYATLTPPTYEQGLDPDIYPYPMTRNDNGSLVRVFEYTTPFLISIDDDLVSSYFLTIMNATKTFTFESINKESNTQFIATNMNWVRKYRYTDESGEDHTYDNKYTMDLTIAQNNNMYNNLVVVKSDANGNDIYEDIRIKIIMVLYSDETETNPYKYLEAKLINVDSSRYSYTFRFTLDTDDFMDINNRINIKNVYNCKPELFQHKSNLEKSHGYMNKNTFAKIFILSDFGYKIGDNVNGVVMTEDKIIVYGDNGGRTTLESILPIRSDIVSEFLKNKLYITKEDEQVSVVSIIKSNQIYLNEVKKYNGDELETETAILRYLRNNTDSDFVKNTLLKDEKCIEVIESYNYIDLSRYTLCNTMAVDGGLDFYNDYSSIMRSTVTVKQVQETDANGNLVFTDIRRSDSFGNEYIEKKPKYLVNENGGYYYNYTVKRIPLLQNNYLNSEESMQDFIYDLEERRRYIEECLYVLEDTFDIDFKFFNTYGPSKIFYYNIPSSQNYKATISVKSVNVLSSTEDESDQSNIVGNIDFGTEVVITKTNGQWGYITSPYTGWIRLADTTKNINYIDNVALTLKFALQAETTADRYIADNIRDDIKEYIEDINSINELHIPNIITLITNNYREQLVYFEFLDANGYGPSCQHIYLDEKIDADICPEFLNVATNIDDNNPNISITVY